VSPPPSPDSVICVTRHMHMCETWHTICVIWITCVCDMTHDLRVINCLYVWHDSSIRVTLANLHVWHDECICMTWLMYTYDMTHPSSLFFFYCGTACVYVWVCVFVYFSVYVYVCVYMQSVGLILCQCVCVYTHTVTIHEYLAHENFCVRFLVLQKTIAGCVRRTKKLLSSWEINKVKLGIL